MIFQETVPTAKMIALLSNSANRTNFDRESSQMQSVASTLGVQLLILDASSASDLETTFATMIERRVGALIVGADPLLLLTVTAS